MKTTKTQLRSELGGLLEQRLHVAPQLGAQPTVEDDRIARFFDLEEPLERAWALAHAAAHWDLHYHNVELGAADQILHEHVLDQLLGLLRDEVQGLHALYHHEREG